MRKILDTFFPPHLVHGLIHLAFVSQLAQVFVYRNVVKALNWFSSVRVLLDDPAYAGFFLRFAGAGENLNPPVGPFHVPPW